MAELDTLRNALDAQKRALEDIQKCIAQYGSEEKSEDSEERAEGEQPAKNLQGAEKNALTRLRRAQNQTSESAPQQTRDKSEQQRGVPKPADRMK